MRQWRNIARALAAAALALLLAACAQPRLQAGSDSEWAASVQAMRESLPAAERDAFDRALVRLAGTEPAPTIAEAAVHANPALAGLGAEDVLARAQRVQRDADRSELAELQALRRKVAADAEEVTGIRVAGSRYYFEGPTPHLELQLANEGSLSIRRFRVRLTLAEAGGGEPLFRSEFSVPLSEPLVPGGTASATMKPSPDSPWGQLRAPRSATMTPALVAVISIDGGQYLTAGSFDDVAAARLAELERADASAATAPD